MRREWRRRVLSDGSRRARRPSVDREARLSVRIGRIRGSPRQAKPLRGSSAPSTKWNPCPSEWPAKRTAFVDGLPAHSALQRDDSSFPKDASWEERTRKSLYPIGPRWSRAHDKSGDGNRPRKPHCSKADSSHRPPLYHGEGSGPPALVPRLVRVSRYPLARFSTDRQLGPSDARKGGS